MDMLTIPIQQIRKLLPHVLSVMNAITQQVTRHGFGHQNSTDIIAGDITRRVSSNTSGGAWNWGAFRTGTEGFCTQ